MREGGRRGEGKREGGRERERERYIYIYKYIYIYVYFIYMGTTSAITYLFSTLNALPPVSGLKKGPFFGTQFRVPKLAFFGCFSSLKTALPLVLASFSHKTCSKTIFLKGFRAFTTLHFNQNARNVNNVNSLL